MKKLLGLLLIVAGVCLGLYVGLYLCFIGGIVQILHEVRAPEMVTSNVVWAVVKIVCSGMAGILSGYALALPGVMLYESKKSLKIT